MASAKRGYFFSKILNLRFTCYLLRPIRAAITLKSLPNSLSRSTSAPISLFPHLAPRSPLPHLPGASASAIWPTKVERVESAVSLLGSISALIVSAGP